MCGEWSTEDQINEARYNETPLELIQAELETLIPVAERVKFRNEADMSSYEFLMQDALQLAEGIERIQAIMDGEL